MGVWEDIMANGGFPAMTIVGLVRVVVEVDVDTSV
jgi:hypothetical protein